MGLGKRDRFIVRAALVYLAANREDANDAFAAPCAYCGGECPSLDPDVDDSYCDGYAGDIDGLYTDECGEIAVEGETSEKIEENELEELLVLFR